MGCECPSLNPPATSSPQHHHGADFNETSWKNFSEMLNNVMPEQITSLEEARSLIEVMRAKYQCRGRQIIAYRKKLHQQRGQMKQAEADHQRQLEGISLELMLFESSLRNKEKQIETTLAAKDQVRAKSHLKRQHYKGPLLLLKVILKQQKLIKKLLRKRGSRSGSVNDLLLDNGASAASVATDATSGTIGGGGGGSRNDNEALNDSSDSAIISDCQIVESLHVPCLVNKRSSPSSETETIVAETTPTLENKVEIISVTTSSPQKSVERKAKEDRQRISNRQKLLLLKRHHSGFLKRPEILETVYSVEEDGEQQHGGPGASNNNEEQRGGREVASISTPSSNEIRRASSSSAPVMSLRRRLDSDLNTYSDYSTDDESTRLQFSETETACSCSQSCSRQSSFSCCRSGQCFVTASEPASRRSSCGSTFNRVMTNHRNVPKPKDIKFKRINKAKSRSLEELRGKLKYPITTRSSSTNDEDIDDLDMDEPSVAAMAANNNRLTLLRAALGQQRSLSLEQESTDTN